ncbi:MAG TPA: tyrosine recombinase XerC [Burkholderiales bacterium]|nr:tyrosine recombinase XerC [Burkholderiales bacterium]
MAVRGSDSATKADPPDAPPFVSDFLSHLIRERRLSPHTAEGYVHDVRVLMELAQEQASSLQDLQIHQIRRFVARLHGRGLGGKSLARMLSAWRSFFNYLARDHGFTRNPCGGVRPPKSPKSLPKALSPDEATRLVSFAESGPLAVRDRAMFELLYSSGLRLSELTSLKIGDVSFADATVRVVGKGNKTRVVPVGSHALHALQAWLPVRESLPHLDESALFLNQRGDAISPRTVQSRLKAWGIKQGLPGHVHPHMLRHSFASHVLQSSGDLRAVQEMLGHASISTTQVYTHLDFQYLAKVYDAAHPRAKRKPFKP